METKQIKIEVPQGYEIDKEKSTFENIILKPIENKLPLSYFEIRDWCEKNNVSFSAVVNALLQPVAHALANSQIESDQLTFQMDFGAIDILP